MMKYIKLFIIIGGLCACQRKTVVIIPEQTLVSTQIITSPIFSDYSDYEERIISCNEDTSFLYSDTVPMVLEFSGGTELVIQKNTFGEAVNLSIQYFSSYENMVANGLYTMSDDGLLSTYSMFKITATVDSGRQEASLNKPMLLNLGDTLSNYNVYSFKDGLWERSGMKNINTRIWYAHPTANRGRSSLSEEFIYRKNDYEKIIGSYGCRFNEKGEIDTFSLLDVEGDDKAYKKKILGKFVDEGMLQYSRTQAGYHRIVSRAVILPLMVTFQLIEEESNEFSITKLGWVNIDKLITKESKDLEVNLVNESFAYNYLLLIPELDAIQYGLRSNDQKLVKFKDVPSAEKLYILIYLVKDNNALSYDIVEYKEGDHVHFKKDLKTTTYKLFEQELKQALR